MFISVSSQSTFISANLHLSFSFKFFISHFLRPVCLWSDIISISKCLKEFRLASLIMCLVGKEKKKGKSRLTIVKQWQLPGQNMQPTILFPNCKL